MLNSINQLDRSLFILINHLPHNFFLDTFFGVLTFAGIYGAVFIVLAFVFYIKHKKKIGKQLVALLIAEITYFILIEILLKNVIERPRPQFSISDVVLPYDFSRSFSFPSGHATISFALAYILGTLSKKHKLFFFILAFLIAFSRIYLGKHYPSDVIAGAGLGLMIGYLSIKITEKNFSKK